MTTARHLPHDPSRASSLLMRLLACDGVTGEESAIAALVIEELVAAGVPRSAIVQDDAHTRMELSSACGNIWAYLPGTGPGEPLMFSTHMDTVPLCRGAVPVLNVDEGVIRPAGVTALGGDNRTGCAVLINLAAALLENKLPHPPITFLFTVREESGLHGARHLDPQYFRGATMGFNVDGGAPGRMVIGAVGAQRWEATVTGIASHAGVHPDRGVSSTMIVALALSEIYAGGWFGKVVRGDREGSSNVGVVAGPTGGSVGEATNVVTDYAMVRGESRSTDARLVGEITEAYRLAFENAAKTVKTSDGRTGTLTFKNRVEYDAFCLPDGHPVVKRAVAAAIQAGITPVLEVSRGGLDANWLVCHGMSAVTFGAGQHDIHTIKEYVNLAEFHDGCRLALSIVTSD